MLVQEKSGNWWLKWVQQNSGLITPLDSSGVQIKGVWGGTTPFLPAKIFILALLLQITGSPQKPGGYQIVEIFRTLITMGSLILSIPQVAFAVQFGPPPDKSMIHREATPTMPTGIAVIQVQVIGHGQVITMERLAFSPHETSMPFTLNLKFYLKEFKNFLMKGLISRSSMGKSGFE